MKHISLALLSFVFASLSAWALPNLKNPALAQIQFGEAPKHAELRLVENGKLNFAVVYDKSNQDRVFTSSVERGALLLCEAVEK